LIRDILVANHLVCASGGAAARAPHLPAFVCRRINTDTYLRRIIVTEQLAALMGADDVVGAIAVDVAVLDAQGQAWPCVFTHRESNVVTGQLSGAWRELCRAHHARVGATVVYERVTGGWQGSGLAVRARVPR
jgi:hypothetical protein